MAEVCTALMGGSLGGGDEEDGGERIVVVRLKRGVKGLGLGLGLGLEEDYIEELLD